MRIRLAGVGSLTGATGALVAFARSARDAAADCVSAQAGRATVRVNCDDEEKVVAGHTGGNFVVIRDSDPEPVPVYAAKPAAVAKPIYPAHPPQPVEPVKVVEPIHPVAKAPLPKPPKSAPAKDDGRPDRDDAGDGPSDGDDPGDGPTDGDDVLTVRLDCDGSPETITVTNDAAHPIAVYEVSPISLDDSGDPIVRDDLIDPGDSITYEGGRGASGRFDLGQDLFPDDAADSGVRLDTSGGEVDEFCFAS